MGQQQVLSIQELQAGTRVEPRLPKPSRMGDVDPGHMLPSHMAALTAAAANLQYASYMLPRCRPQ